MEASKVCKAGWLTRSVLLCGCIGVAMFCASGCSSDSDDERDGGMDGDVGFEDAGVGDGSTDAGDARPRDVEAPDAEPPDLGTCNCSYGFHQGCGEGEMCALGFSGAPICTRAEPLGDGVSPGCTMTSTSEGAACNAQCVRATERASPCGETGFGTVSDIMNFWWLGISHAADGPGSEPEALTQTDIEQAVRVATPSPACGEFVQWTTVALMALCRGDDAVIPPAAGRRNRIEEWRFRKIAPDDECQRAGGVCVGAVTGENENYLDSILTDCPTVLPYGAPCAGLGRTEAHDCLKQRVHTIIKALGGSPPGG